MRRVVPLAFARIAVLAVVLLAALMLNAGTAFASPTLTTGKADYHPGEVVDISGSGFVPGETYAMPVKRPDGSIVTVDPILHLATPGWEYATADAYGNLVYNYQLNGVEGSYEARAYPASWAGDWSEAPVASVTFTDSPTRIDASTHQGQQKTLGVLGSYTSGNVTQYTEGEDINFRFTLSATHGPADGQIEVRFSRDDGNCIFFDQAFSLGTVEALSGPQPTVTVQSGPTASGDGTEWIVVLDVDYATTFDHVANEARVNYTLTLSDEAGECNGSSQHSRLSPGGGDVAQTGQQNVPVPANQVVELPEITVTKMIDRDGNGSFESTAAAGEYKFVLDGTTELFTDANGQVVFENVSPDGAHTVTEQQIDFSQGTYSFDSGQNVSNCLFTGSTANPIVAAGTTATNASCTFRNEPLSASITVDKDFSDDSSGEVTVSLDCGTATETTVDGTATETDDAEFTVSGFDADDVCTASEGTAPAGYTKNESDCQNFDPESKTSCQIVNTLNSAVVNVAKDFQPDNGTGSVTVSLDCGPGVNVVDDDTSATEADTADFTVEGFTSSTTCSASEGSAPAGYTKDESGCQSIDPEQVGLGAECTIVNTLNTTTITVDKDFSDDSAGTVTVDLTCASGTVTDTDDTATETDDAEFLVEGFTPGDTCDASEGAAPTGYTKDESDCQDLVLGTDTSCRIVNTLNSVSITVDKDFSDDSAGTVTVDLTCASGTVTDTDDTATETDDAEFLVEGFTPGDTCDASEGAAPTGYTKDESDCQDLVLGTDTSCRIVNTLNSVSITVDKDFSDDSAGTVTVDLTCASGTVTDTDDTATETDDAEFLVEGFTPGDTCDASEGAAPTGYTKDESDCQDLVLGTDTSCRIVNTLNSVSITVDKDFSDDSAGTVTVDLTCASGTVTDTDDTATETDDAEFLVEGFTPGDTCDASEGAAPTGYTKDESDCQDLVLGTDTSCRIVNTLNTAVVNVAKDFSDNSAAEVTVSLDCGQGVTVVDDDTSASETDTADFTVKGFVGSTTCSASEGSAPAGYAKDESGCQSIDPEQVGPGAECTIVNTLNTTTITVDKDFSDDALGEVTIALTCASGTVTNTDATATEIDDAEFLVEGFTPGDTCDASEGSAPSGYTKDESDCQGLVLGTDTSCQIVNTRKRGGGGGGGDDDTPDDDPSVPPRVPDAPTPPIVPPVLDTEGNCLRRPIVAFVRGRPIKRVVFKLNGKRIKVVKRPDSDGRWSVRIERRKLREGTHYLLAKVFLQGRTKAYRLSLDIKPCLDKTAPDAISITGRAGRGHCPAKDFLAYVKGETISSVSYSLNGRSLGVVEVADWKKRYGVSIDPSQLGPGQNNLEATVRFIARSKTAPRVLRAELPSCAGS